MKLGVIGGLGPLATAYFYELLTRMSIVERDQDHLEIIIYSCPSIPDRTSYILDKNCDDPLPKMIKIAKTLESQEVDYIVIPCVTAHYFYDELQKTINVPIIHLVEEIGKYLNRNNINYAGIMATNGTISTRLFQKELYKQEVNCIVPKSQSSVMHIIYENIKKGKEIEMNHFINVSNELKKSGAQVIILGCTELSIVKKEKKLENFYLDAMELLSAVSLKKCGMKIQDEYKYLVE